MIDGLSDENGKKKKLLRKNMFKKNLIRMRGAGKRKYPALS